MLLAAVLEASVEPWAALSTGRQGREEKVKLKVTTVWAQEYSRCKEDKAVRGTGCGQEEGAALWSLRQPLTDRRVGAYPGLP